MIGLPLEERRWMPHGVQSGALAPLGLISIFSVMHSPHVIATV